ncbi:FTR1 family iron permease [Tepidibacillus decaturensis]|uniref:Iron permease n=1 Tax=Tepidibacillus decaturensis TaxID=1413211 RepID=A0A135L6W8_9BACI|nr:FTR1 family protein [Tepidibacillus decaturensis]KXG44716.1 iron permease [Tepidibacillus decaturensis]
MDFQAFLITFREGLEAFLIIGIIITYLKKMDRAKYNKWVWTGAFGAVISSLLMALIFQVVLTGFTSMGSQNYMKLGIMLVSSVLLTQMIFWMNENNRDVHTKTQDKLSQIVTTGSVIGMVTHAYLVVLREGVETVFFFAAITGGDITRAIESKGALFGLILSAVIAYLMFKGLVRFPLKTFFKITGILIMMIAAGLLVQGIGMMQDLGILGSAMPEVYNIIGFMPEHPIDAAQYIRDTGKQPLISGQVGIFMKAMFGYSHHPSIEELLAYLGYFIVVIFWVRYTNQRKEENKANEANTENNSFKANHPTAV